MIEPISFPSFTASNTLGSLDQSLLQEGVKIDRKSMKNIVFAYIDSLPQSIDEVDTSKMNTGQINNLKEVINGKVGIDKKIHNFETMKDEVVKLRLSMAKLYPEKLYAPELALITNSIKYALDVGVPRYLIKKRFKNINKISTNFWRKKANRNLSLGLRPPPGVY